MSGHDLILLGKSRMFVGHWCYVCYFHNWHGEYKHCTNTNMNFGGSVRSEKASSFGIILKVHESSQTQLRADNRPKPRDAQVWDSVITEILSDSDSAYPWKL